MYKILLMLFVFPINVWANLDYSLSSYLRTYPYGGGLDASFGYSQILWGDKNKSINYGYFRPAINLSSIGSYNKVEARLEVYPISFFGVKAGYSSFENYKNYSAFDCQKYSCLINTNTEFTEVEALAAYRRMFFLARYKWQYINASEGSFNGDLLIPAPALAINRAGEKVDSALFVAGYKWSEKFATAMVFPQAKSNKQLSFAQLLSFSYKPSKKWSYDIALGSFQSSLVEAGFTAYLQALWRPKRSLGLN